jgi:hypothetical protein
MSAATKRSRNAARPARAARRPAAPPAPAWTSIVIGLVVFALYAALTPPAAGDKDSSEFILVLARLGTPHPTGYPLYTLLGHLWVTAVHALGIGWDRAGNLWSAFGGGLAMGLLHALSARLLAREGVAARAAALLALLPVGAFALHPFVTIETTLAEVNAFHLAWVAGAMLTLLSAVEGFQRDDAAHDLRRVGIAALVGGLGLQHHATSVLVLVPAALAMLFAARSAGRLNARLVVVALVGLSLPLTAHLWTAWRAFHPIEPHWHSLRPDWSSILDHLTGAEYRFYLGHWNPSEVQRGAMSLYLWPWFVPALFLALPWLLAGRGTPGAVRAAWAASIAITTLYARNYGVPDPSSYFLPPFLLALAVIPASCALAATMRRAAPALGALAGLALLVVSWKWFGIGRGRAEYYVQFDRHIHSLWRAVPFDHGFVLWPNDMVHRLHKYQWLDGERPGLDAYNPMSLTHDRPRAEFLARHGFDPGEPERLRARLGAVSMQPGTELFDAIGAAVVAEVNERSPLPIALIQGGIPRMELVPKPGADSTRAR